MKKFIATIFIALMVMIAFAVAAEAVYRRERIRSGYIPIEFDRRHGRIYYDNNYYNIDRYSRIYYDNDYYRIVYFYDRYGRLHRVIVDPDNYYPYGSSRAYRIIRYVDRDGFGYRDYDRRYRDFDYRYR